MMPTTTPSENLFIVRMLSCLLTYLCNDLAGPATKELHANRSRSVASQGTEPVSRSLRRLGV